MVPCVISFELSIETIVQKELQLERLQYKSSWESIKEKDYIMNTMYFSPGDNAVWWVSEYPCAPQLDWLLYTPDNDPLGFDALSPDQISLFPGFDFVFIDWSEK